MSKGQILLILRQFLSKKFHLLNQGVRIIKGLRKGLCNQKRVISPSNLFKPFIYLNSEGINMFFDHITLFLKMVGQEDFPLSSNLES